MDFNKVMEGLAKQMANMNPNEFMEKMVRQMSNMDPKFLQQMGMAKQMSDMDPKQFMEQIEMAKQSERNNNLPPRARPFKDRASLLLNFAYRVADRKAKGLGTKEVMQIKNTTITGKAHCCLKPLSKLTPIKLSAMKVPMVHCGTFLICRVLTEPIVIVGTEVLVEDVEGHVEGLCLYNFNSDLNNCTWLKPGTIMLVKEPYLKYSAMCVDNAMIRVDSVSDVIFVEESDRELLARANALCWFKAERQSFDALKQQANNAFRQKDYEGAIRLYRRALNVQPGSSPIIHLNLAAALLKVEHFYEARQEANEALRGGGVDDEKALFRLGKAAYGLRNWAKAVEHFETLLDRFPENPDTLPELHKARARQDEARNGKYDFHQLYLDSEKGKVHMDVADYVGPVKEADIKGKGKGLIMTRNVKKGTLLIASKAYAMRKLTMETMKDDGLMHSVNMITNEFYSSTQVHLVIDTMQMLKRNPQTSKELYALFAGDDVNREAMTVSEGIIDAGRIERICSYNSYQPQDFGIVELHREKQQQQQHENLDFEGNNSMLSASGLWLLPSFINHSCLENAYRIFFGDIMFIHALRDLKRGEELTLSYLDPMDLYTNRRQKLEKWKFTCQCLLCKLDGADPSGEKQREELMQEYDKMKPHILKKPMAWMVELQNLVSQLRLSYDSAKRTEQRVHLARPLMLLAWVHQLLGHFGKSIECFQECLASVGQPLVYMLTPHIQLKMAELFALMAKRQMANKMVEEAYQMTKVKMGGGICRDLFSSMFNQPM